MAFEIPAHLRKDPSAGAGADPSSTGAAASGPAASDHIKTLLEPLLAEDWTKLSARDVVSHRQRLELDAQTTKNTVLKLISSNYDAVSSQLNGSIDSKQRGEELKSKLASLELQVEGDDKTQSLVPPLVRALQTHSTLAHRLLLSQSQLSLTKLLQTYRQTFSPLVARAPPSLVDSIGIWSKCTELLARPEWDWGSSTGDGLGALKLDLVERLRVVRDRVEEELGAVWDAVVSTSWDPTDGRGVVSVQPPRGGLSTAQLVDALRLLGTLPARTQTLAGHLLNDVLRPLLLASATEATTSFAQSTAADGGLALFHLGKGTVPPTAEKQWQSSPTLLPLLQALLAFLSTALPPLPTSADASGPAKDLSSLLVSPLIPLLVSEHLSLALRSLASPAALPAFAEAASSFAAWERETTSGRSTELAGFAAGVGGTWSKWRRADVLACAREIVGGVVEGDERDDSWLEREAKNGWEGWVWERQTIIPADVEPAAAVEPEPVAPAQAPAAEEADGWSFKDPPAPADVSPVSLPISPPTLVETPDAADDGDDAWGFDDDAAPVSPPPPPLPPAPPVDDEPDAWGFSGSDDDKPIVINKAQPRQAKRLGKAKGKSASVDTTHQPALSPSGSLSSSIAAHAVGALDSGVESGSASRTSSPAPAAAKKGAMKLGKKAALPSSRATPEPESSLDLDVPPQLPSPVRESGPRIVIDRLRISERVKPLFELGREISQEVDELQNLSIDRVPAGSATSSPSLLLRKTVPAVFSLFRALLPVAHQAALVSSPALAMQAVNDCEWLAEQVQALFGPEDETGGLLRGAGDKWFQDELIRREAGVHLILDGAFSFVDCGDEQRASDCESAVADVVARIEELSFSWKPVLPLERAFVALGAVLDSVLARILKEITDLNDITTAESQRLTEIVKLVHPVEELFTESPGAPSVVVGYVPSWLKFCYLSELLEASMADITYLFDSGALIDFAPDELARLVRALFSDNSLRAKTIDRIMAGHPAV